MQWGLKTHIPTVRGLCFHPACAPVALCWACAWACAIGLMSRSQRRCALHSAPATRLAQAQTPLPHPAAAAGPSRRTRRGSLLTRWRRRSACSASWRQRRLLLLVATQRRSSWRGSWRRSNRRWVRRGAARCGAVGFFKGQPLELHHVNSRVPAWALVGEVGWLHGCNVGWRRGLHGTDRWKRVALEQREFASLILALTARSPHLPPVVAAAVGGSS